MWYKLIPDMRHRVRRFSDAVFLYAARFDGYATAGGGWNVTGAEKVKSNAPASIVEPEVLHTNQELAEAVNIHGIVCINFRFGFLHKRIE